MQIIANKTFFPAFPTHTDIHTPVYPRTTHPPLNDPIYI